MTNTDFWDSLDTVSTTPTPTPSPFQEEILDSFDASTIMGELNSLEGTQTED